MKLASKFALAGCAAAWLVCAAPAAHAQVQTAAPIKLKQPKLKTLKYKGTVIIATRVQITVRDPANERMVRTFRLSEEMQGKMQEIIDKGGYQHGDKVEIHHVEGTDVATKIKGKPSKSPR